MDAVYLITAALPLPHDHGIPAGIILLPVYNSSELAESLASLTNTPALHWSWIQNEIVDVWLNTGMQHPTSMVTKITACTSLAAPITLDSESESPDPWLTTVCHITETDEPTQNQWIAPFLVMLHMMMVEHLGSQAANSNAMTCKYGQFMQDAFDYMVTDPNPFGVRMIKTAKEMFTMFEPATQAWRSQLPFFMFSIPAMFELPCISSYLSDDQPIKIALRGKNIVPPDPPGLQSLQSRAAAGEDGPPYPSEEHSVTSNQTSPVLLSLLGFLSTGCTPQTQKQAPPPSPIDFAGASDDASLPSLPTHKQQINFEDTTDQQDIGSSKSPNSSNCNLHGHKDSKVPFWNLKIASPNAFANESMGTDRMLYSRDLEESSTPCS